MYKDASADVRRQALNALGQFDTPEAAEAIASSLGDADPEVRAYASRLVGNLISFGVHEGEQLPRVDAIRGLRRAAVPRRGDGALVGLGRFLDDLRSSGIAYPAVRRCSIHRSGSREATSLRARCEIELLTIAERKKA